MTKVFPFVRNPENIGNEVEQCLLGVILYKPETINDVSDILRPEMFVHIAHQCIYSTLERHANQGRKHTALTIEPHISDGLFPTNQEKRFYLQGLVGMVISPTMARDYARYVVEQYNSRRIRSINTDPSLSDLDRAAQMAEIWREVGKPDGSEFVTIGNALEITFLDIERRYREGGGLNGLSTGIPDLDKTLCGLEDGNLYVLAGRPAMGKTAMGLTIAMNAAMKQRPVLFFSLEMSSEQLSHRVNARFSTNNMWAQRNARDIDFVSLMDARNDLSQVPLTIVDKSGLTAEQISFKAFELHRKMPQALIVIDHLAIVAARDMNTPRVHQVAEMTMRFKVMAKELDIPVLLLHQLNRGVEGRDDKRPGLSDLRDSGSIEQDADAVMLLYRKEYYLKNKEPESYAASQKLQDDLRASAGKAELIIAKNRQGETKIINMHFDGARQAFEGLVQNG